MRGCRIICSFIKRFMRGRNLGACKVWVLVVVVVDVVKGMLCVVGGGGEKVVVGVRMRSGKCQLLHFLEFKTVGNVMIWS